MKKKRLRKKRREEKCGNHQEEKKIDEATKAHIRRIESCISELHKKQANQRVEEFAKLSSQIHDRMPVIAAKDLKKYGLPE